MFNLCSKNKIFIKDLSSGISLGPSLAEIQLPQGSPYSSDLFNSYTDSLKFEVVGNCKLLQYAFDLDLMFSGSDLKEVINLINRSLGNINFCLNLHNLNISPA